MTPPIESEGIERRIFMIRGYRVMLDSDLAVIYGVSTKQLNQAIRRNPRRFPVDFMFRLSSAEDVALRSQIVTSKGGRGGRRYLPCVFTEHGAIMLSSVLHTPLAIDASLLIARAFVRLRRMASANKGMAKDLKKLERRVTGHDEQISGIMETIRQLEVPLAPPPRRIGFGPD